MITACLNCRDDEHTIRRWLDLFAPRVTEVVICDTGSRDRTLEIIRAAPYENVVLHERRWTGFIDGRNRFFELASQPFILQVDADELLLDDFFVRLPAYISRLEEGSDSIRLPHYWSEFDYSSMDDVVRRVGRFAENFTFFSYPRDVLYRADLPGRGVGWVDTNGAEILNNLDTTRFHLAEDVLIHCVPAEHKLNDDEFHARKMLAYARDLGGPISDGWRQFIERFPPEHVERMRNDTYADPADPAPHATWWGKVGHLRNRDRSNRAREQGGLPPRPQVPVGDSSDPATLYIELLKRCLLDRFYGSDGSASPHTTISLERLTNIQACVESILENQVPGDLVAAGVRRGGASILMRALLRCHGVTDRQVWVADPFGCAPPLGAGDVQLRHDQTLPIEQIRACFRRYDLLDAQVGFLKGWFGTSLPVAPIGRLALLRVDAGGYESTMDVLRHLCPRLSAGGFVIVDDRAPGTGRRAVDEYREEHRIEEPIHQIDEGAFYWRRGVGAASHRPV